MQTWQETYELLVYNIEATFSDRKEGAYYLKQAMLIIIDLETSDELGTKAATDLMPKIDYFYRWIFNYFDIEENRRLLVYQINEFTERHMGDLTTFVNSIDWIDGCVPHNWVETSEGSPYDTSGWVVCS